MIIFYSLPDLLHGGPITTLFKENNMSLVTFNSLFESFFLNWPEQSKPPISHFPILDADKSVAGLCESTDLKGWEIQLAVAGYTENDLKVWYENHILHISGDNTEREISHKFKCKFDHSLNVHSGLDLSKSEVSLSMGILSIKIPINKYKEEEKYLFGTK